MSPQRVARHLLAAFVAAVGRMDKSLEPRQTLAKLKRHKFTYRDAIYIFHAANALFWLSMLPAAAFPLQILLPALFGIALIIPFTSQFFLPAIPVFTWLLTYFTSRFIPTHWRPSISVSFLPTLETVLYGANISDLLTRYTHPFLDALAWLPYGFLHFVLPFVVAIFLWLFRPKQALHFWARAFGYQNTVAVMLQLMFPCSPPWYEIVYGLTPADYSIPGSAGGLLRFDRLMGTHGYQATFGASPLVFGAFPSLHAGNATLEALFLSYFFPQATRYIWTYAAVMYWATMYLSHHYLIDVVAGACMAVAWFHLLMPDELTGPAATAPPGGLAPGAGVGLGISGIRGRNKYAAYDIDPPANGLPAHNDMDEPASEDEEVDITYNYRSPSAGTTEFGAQAAGARVQAAKKSHRHTASIASLIREGDRVEEGWSPIGSSFSFPPTPTRAQMQMERDAESGRVPRA